MSAAADKVTAARQRVREAKAAWREAQKQAVSGHKALKRSLRERDVAAAKVRKAERALGEAMGHARGRRIGGKIYRHSADLARLVLERWAHLDGQPAEAIRLGLDVHSDGVLGRTHSNYAALAELRRLLDPPKKRGGK